MPLHDLICLRQSNSATCLFGCEVQLKNFVLDFWSYSTALVANLGHDCFVASPGGERERPAIGHRLNTVQDNVQDGLFDEIDVNLDRNRVGRKVAKKIDSMLL